MASYTPIADSEVQPGAIGSSTLFERLRDNPEAIIEGNGPKIADGAFAVNTLSGDKVADNTMSGAKLLNNSVSGPKILDKSVGISKLNLLESSLTGSINAGAIVDLAFNRGTLWIRPEVGSGPVALECITAVGTAQQPAVRLRNNGGISTSYTVRWEYIGA